MGKPVISVIMSTYNETKDEIKKSIDSILKQSYTDFEFLIINDNPDNVELPILLNSITDKRIKVFYNKKNIGLVKSLNKGLSLAEGLYIARMDADDISYPTRLQNELNYMQYNHLDMTGSFIEIIDENNETIKSVMKFPVLHNRIKWFMKWGSCISHPTWLVKKEVYTKLNGYRDALYCEDYDFILRTIISGYKVGNLPKVELKYRIRQTGISKSNADNQYLLRDYLAKNMSKINDITEAEIAQYLESEEFQTEKDKLLNYKKNKIRLKERSVSEKINSIESIVFNHYFWKDLIEKFNLWAREHY